MLHPKIEVHLRERDAARARSDHGIDRTLTADLRRWGVPDDATLANPEGNLRSGGLITATAEAPAFLEHEYVLNNEQVREVAKKRRGRPPKPRCEHGKIADRCIDCNEELAA